MADRDELSALRAENARLIALLESHGIEWRARQQPSSPPAEPSRLSTDEKVALFRSLFRGRSDVFPVRWESKTTGKSGYAPACANEWRAGVCEKPRIKCGACSHRLLIPLSDAVIYKHLAGEYTVGVSRHCCACGTSACSGAAAGRPWRSVPPSVRATMSGPRQHPFGETARMNWSSSKAGAWPGAGVVPWGRWQWCCGVADSAWRGPRPSAR